MHTHRIMRPISILVLCELTLVILCGILPSTANGQQPVPIIQNMVAGATVSFDQFSSTYSYTYNFHSLNSNTGDVSGISIDISIQPAGNFNNNHSLPEYADAVRRSLDKKNISVLPVNVTAPPSWHAIDITALGTAHWLEVTESATLGPGQTVNGFELSTKFVPGIRKLTLSPAITTWGLYPDASDPEEIIQQQEALIKSLDYVDYTLGPVWVTAGSFAHWNQLRDDINQAIALGWVADTALADTLVSQLATAREARDLRDNGLTRSRLETLIATADQSTLAQRRQEVRDLVVLNAQRLLELTPIPVEPQITLTPKTTELPIDKDEKTLWLALGRQLVSTAQKLAVK